MTKASVTIVFDNHDKAKSPIGFDTYDQISVTRQIVLGGTSKYLINGHRAQQQTVQNLFQSVQLNINNPNFLIMQGRITKVLNMKPVELLGMIEEAAGTRMFEERRDRAIKTMGKKEMKVQEIEELLLEEIGPKLERLRGEKRAWLDYQQTMGDVERLTRVVVASDYLRGRERRERCQVELTDGKARMTELDKGEEKMRREVERLKEDVERVRAVREKELRKGGKFKALEEEVKVKGHEAVRLATVLELKRAGVQEGEEKTEGMMALAGELEVQMEAKRTMHKKLQEDYDTAKAELNRTTDEMDRKEELLQTLQTGVASREGQENGYQGQLQDARNRLSAATTEQEQAKMKMQHLEKRIKEEEPRAKKAQDQNSGLLKELEKLRLQRRKLESDLVKTGADPAREDGMQKEESSVKERIRSLREQADGLRRKVSNIDFGYSDPSPGFDRSKVKGLVAQLFTLDPHQTKAGTALEICAGGRLYNVVVDNEVTGTQLLQHGKLRKRVTIIPLNKISAFRASAEKVGAAQKIAPGKVELALSLIGFEEEVTAAMEYVFGSMLVCDDADTAQRVTFDPSVRMKSVTLQGDVYDPSGTLSGGSSPNTSGVLVTLGRLNELVRDLHVQEMALASLQATINRDRKKMDGARQLRQTLDLKTHEIALTEEQIASNSSSAIISALEGMRSNIAALQASTASARLCQDEARKDIQRIEKDMSDFSSNKDSKLAELQQSLDRLKEGHLESSHSLKALQRELQSARLDVEQSATDLSAARETLEEVTATLTSQKAEVDGLISAQTIVREALELTQASLDRESARLTSFDDELLALERTIRSKTAAMSESHLERQALSHTLERLSKDQGSAAATVTSLEAEHEWIVDEAHLFGRAGTAYDLTGQNVAELKSSLRSLTERFQGMKKKINPKVMNMIDSVEKKEVALKNMMRTVVRDKSKIEETIHTLDEYKKEALEKTWRKVNGDFGGIFEELLPGSWAKLVPSNEEKGVGGGLEVKVCLGKVWKESLTELSGGQRYVSPATARYSRTDKD